MSTPLPAPIVVTGPTGAGKSDLALAIARMYDAVIVSMDAMQVYRGFDIGTAKLPLADRDPAAGGVEHRCIDVVDWNGAFSAAEFAREVDDVLRTRRVVMCGGSTFYLRAWEQGLVDAPAVDADLRARLESLPDVHAALAVVDPVLAARLHPNDRVRLIRGLEYHAQTGTRLSDAHAADPARALDGRAAELVYADRVEAWVGRLVPEAPPALPALFTPPAPTQARHCSASLPSCQTAKPTSGRTSAWRRTASRQCANSVASVFKNLRRAGVA